MKIILLSILLIFAIGIICEQSVFGNEEGDCFEGYNDNCKESKYVIWDENRPLTWDDFQGVPGSSCGIGTFPYYVSPTACTKTQTSWQVLVKGDERYGCEIIKLDVAVLFGKFNSWVDLDNTEISYVDVLKHEQGHFDIAQIHAQKFKTTYEGKTFACLSGVQDMVDSEINWNEIFKQEKAMQKAYDKETGVGIQKEEQAEWDKKIISLLSTGEYVKEVSIPKWIKNNAGWWAKGQIDDSAFVQGIQFLIKVGIIQVEIELPDGWTDKDCHKYWETCLTYSD